MILWLLLLWSCWVCTEGRGVSAHDPNHNTELDTDTTLFVDNNEYGVLLTDQNINMVFRRTESQSGTKVKRQTKKDSDMPTFKSEREMNVLLHYSSKVQPVGKILLKQGRSKLTANLNIPNMLKGIDTLRYRLISLGVSGSYDLIEKKTISRSGPDLTILRSTLKLEDGDTVCHALSLELAGLHNVGTVGIPEENILLLDSISVSGTKINCAGTGYSELSANCYTFLSRSARKLNVTFFDTFKSFQHTLKRDHQDHTVHLQLNKTHMTISPSSFGKTACVGDLKGMNRTTTLKNNIKNIFHRHVYEALSQQLDLIDDNMDEATILLAELSNFMSDDIRPKPQQISDDEMIEVIRRTVPIETNKQLYKVSEGKYDKLLEVIRSKNSQNSSSIPWIEEFRNVDFKTVSSILIKRVYSAVTTHTSVTMARLENIGRTFSTKNIEKILPLKILTEQNEDPMFLLSALLNIFGTELDQEIMLEVLRITSRYETVIFRDVGDLLRIEYEPTFMKVPARLSKPTNINVQLNEPTDENIVVNNVQADDGNRDGSADTDVQNNSRIHILDRGTTHTVDETAMLDEVYRALLSMNRSDTNQQSRQKRENNTYNSNSSTTISVRNTINITSTRSISTSTLIIPDVTTSTTVTPHQIETVKAAPVSPTTITTTTPLFTGSTTTKTTTTTSVPSVVIPLETITTTSTTTPTSVSPTESATKETTTTTTVESATIPPLATTTTNTKETTTEKTTTATTSVSSITTLTTASTSSPSTSQMASDSTTTTKTSLPSQKEVTTAITSLSSTKVSTTPAATTISSTSTTTRIETTATETTLPAVTTLPTLLFSRSTTTPKESPTTVADAVTTTVTQTAEIHTTTKPHVRPTIPLINRTVKTTLVAEPRRTTSTTTVPTTRPKISARKLSQNFTTTATPDIQDEELRQALLNMGRRRRSIFSNFWSTALGLATNEEMSKAVEFENALLLKERHIEEVLNSTRLATNTLITNLGNVTENLNAFAITENQALKDIQEVLAKQLKDEETLEQLNIATQTNIKITAELFLYLQELLLLKECVANLENTLDKAIRGEVDVKLFNIQELVKLLGHWIIDSIINAEVNIIINEGDYWIEYQVDRVGNPLKLYRLQTMPFRENPKRFNMIIVEPLVAVTDTFDYSFPKRLMIDCTKVGTTYYCDEDNLPITRYLTETCEHTLIRSYLYSNVNNSYSACIPRIGAGDFNGMQVHNQRNGIVMIVSKVEDIGKWVCGDNKEHETITIRPGYNLVGAKFSSCLLETSFTHTRVKYNNSDITGYNDALELDVALALSTIDEKLDITFNNELNISNVTNLVQNISNEIESNNADIKLIHDNKELIKRIDKIGQFDPFKLDMRKMDSNSALGVLFWCILIVIFGGSIFGCIKLFLNTPLRLICQISKCCAKAAKKAGDSIELREHSNPLLDRGIEDISWSEIRDERNWEFDAAKKKLNFIDKKGRKTEYDTSRQALVRDGHLVTFVELPSAIKRRWNSIIEEPAQEI